MQSNRKLELNEFEWKIKAMTTNRLLNEICVGCPVNMPQTVYKADVEDPFRAVNHAMYGLDSPYDG